MVALQENVTVLTRKYNADLLLPVQDVLTSRRSGSTRDVDWSTAGCSLTVGEVRATRKLSATRKL